MRAVVDSQMQSIGTGATESIVVVMDVSSAFGVGQFGSRCPGVAFAFSEGGCVVRSIMDGEMQCVSAGTSITIVVVVDIGAAFSVVLSCTFCPGVAFALSDVDHIVRAIMDGQVQCVGTGATESIVVVMDVSSAFGVGQTCSRCPSVAFALGDGSCVVCPIMNSQMQGVGARATISIIVFMDVCSAFGVG